MADPTVQKCTRCGEVKPLADFHKQTRAPSGRRSKCRSCVGAYQRTYYKVNRERIEAYKAENREERREADAAYKRAYYLAQREQTIARSKAWRDSNREKADEYRRQYYEANREQAIADTKRWAQENPELRTAQRHLYSARRRTNGQAKVEQVDLLALWDGLCGICRESLDRDLKHPHPLSKSVDHIIPLAKGGPHSQENLQWAHFRCNTRKGDRLID